MTSRNRAGLAISPSSTRWWRVPRNALTVVVAGVLVAAACGGSDQTKTRSSGNGAGDGDVMSESPRTGFAPSTPGSVAPSSTSAATTAPTAPTAVATTVAATVTTAPPTASTLAVGGCLATANDLAKTVIGYAKSQQPSVAMTVVETVYAPVDHAWAKIVVAPVSHSSGIEGFLAIAHCVGSQWIVVDAGTSGVGCHPPVPAAVSKQIGVEC